VTVGNVAPVLSNVLITPLVAVGQPAVLTGTIADPGTQDVFMLVVNWGDGSPMESFSLPAGSTSFNVSHDYAAESVSFPVSVALFDDDGGMASASTSVAVCGFVTKLYEDVLERSPDAFGLAFWQQVLSAGATRTQVAAQFWVSPEHRGLQVDDFYATFLNRAADPAGRTFWVNMLLAGVTEADVVIGFTTSPEYGLAHADNRSFVQGLYQDILQRGFASNTLTEAEVAFWQSVLDRGERTRAAVTFYFLSADESYQTAITEYYAEFLRRTPGPSERQFWLDRILSGSETPVSFASAFLGSEEYLALSCAPVTR
jgi:hypothetical protein